MEGVVILIVIALAVGIGFRVLAGNMDHDRIRDYVRNDGGTVDEIAWEPFGPGWFGEKNDRIYRVRYTDRHGNEHVAHCKTSMWTGVYFTEDKVVRYANRTPATPRPARPTTESLEAENQRLRDEVERLKRERGGA